MRAGGHRRRRWRRQRNRSGGQASIASFMHDSISSNTWPAPIAIAIWPRAACCKSTGRVHHDVGRRCCGPQCHFRNVRFVQDASRHSCWTIITMLVERRRTQA